MDQVEINEDGTLLLADASPTVRAEFYRKTYMHLALAFLLFVGVEAIFLNTPFIVEIGLAMTQGWIWMGVLVGFMLVTSMAEKWALGTGNKQLQYAGFGLYILAEAFLFVPLLYIAMAVSEDGLLLTKALSVTLALFVGLSLVVFTTKQDFSFLRSTLMIGGVVAFGAGIAFGFDLGLWFSVGMILLAAGSILYQTSNLIHRYDSSQYVAASLGLFASFMLLLWYVIQFFLSRD